MSDTTHPKLYQMLISGWPEWMILILPYTQIHLPTKKFAVTSWSWRCPNSPKTKEEVNSGCVFCTVNQVLMCLHSRMGNNNWLKQSLLWENKRPAGVVSEGQAWWHSKYLNSHWLLGRQRALSTSWSLPGRDRFTQPLGLGVRMLFHSHLPLLGLQSHLFPLQCHSITLTPVPLSLTAWNQRETQSCARGCVFLFFWTIALWSWLMLHELMSM